MLIKSNIARLVALVVVICLVKSSCAFNFKSRAFLNTPKSTSIAAIQGQRSIPTIMKSSSINTDQYPYDTRRFENMKFIRNQDTSLPATVAAPIIKEESENFGKTMKKILPLGAMLFFILFNYTILRDTKDVLVVTAPGGGAEMIPFLVSSATHVGDTVAQ